LYFEWVDAFSVVTEAADKGFDDPNRELDGAAIAGKGAVQRVACPPPGDPKGSEGRVSPREKGEVGIDSYSTYRKPMKHSIDPTLRELAKALSKGDKRSGRAMIAVRRLLPEISAHEG
jgi:hypothetical protein